MYYRSYGVFPTAEEGNRGNGGLLIRPFSFVPLEPGKKERKDVDWLGRFPGIMYVVQEETSKRQKTARARNALILRKACLFGTTFCLSLRRISGSPLAGATPGRIFLVAMFFVSPLLFFFFSHTVVFMCSSLFASYFSFCLCVSS